MPDPSEEWPKWAQPIGAHDAYTAGAKVSHSEKKWTSDLDNNVWEPGVYGLSLIHIFLKPQNCVLCHSAPFPIPFLSGVFHKENLTGISSDRIGMDRI